MCTPEMARATTRRWISEVWAFDLSSYDDVKDNAGAILERLRDGSMPCDGQWPQDQVERFQRWTETGMRN